MPPLAKTLALLAITPMAARADTYVFLLAGQSNMAGRGNNADIAYVADARIRSYDDGLAGNPAGIATAGYTLRHDKWGSASQTWRVGPGTFFASALLPTLGAGDSILLVNRAWGGTSSAQWQPGAGLPTGVDYVAANNLYNTALNDFHAAMNAVTAGGGTARVGGILWLQGETDATNGVAVSAYHSNTVNTLDGLRDAIDTTYGIGNDATRIVIGQIGTWYANGDAYRNEQTIIAGELGAGLASSTGLTARSTFDTNTHFDATSQQIMGGRMASAYAAIPEPSTYALTGVITLTLAVAGRSRRERKRAQAGLRV